MTAKVGRYQLKTKGIASGANGSVHEAVNVDNGNLVAIKIVKNRKNDPNARKTCARESTVLRRLAHPHVIRLLDVVETRDAAYLVTDLIPKGRNLTSLLLSQPCHRLRELTARKLFRQCLSAIDYCHRVGVVHRDLKLENILLTEDDDVVIADFGFATWVNTGFDLSTTCGTPTYACPELFSKEPSYNGRSVDIWALGVVLFHLIAGYGPFDASTIAAVRNLVLKGDFDMPTFFSQDVRDVISRMLEVEPMKRITMAELIQHPWVVAGEGDGTVLGAYTDDLTKSYGRLMATVENSLGSEEDAQVVAEVTTSPPPVSPQLVASSFNFHDCDQILMPVDMAVSPVDSAEDSDCYSFGMDTNSPMRRARSRGDSGRDENVFIVVDDYHDDDGHQRGITSGQPRVKLTTTRSEPLLQHLRVPSKSSTAASRSRPRSRGACTAHRPAKSPTPSAVQDPQPRIRYAYHSLSRGSSVHSSLSSPTSTSQSNPITPTRTPPSSHTVLPAATKPKSASTPLFPFFTHMFRRKKTKH